MNPFAYFFSRKRELLLLGAIVIACALGSKIIAIDYWESLNYQVTGYHPLIGVIAFIWMAAYLTILFLRRIRAPALWIMGIAGLIYSLILIWMLNLQ